MTVRTVDYGQIDAETERRFWAKVIRGNKGACWIWTAAKSSAGYGRFLLNQKNRGAHRVAYLILHGSIPEGMDLDHLCRVRDCVNPDHLEPVTSLENKIRAFAAHTHCSNNHEWSDENSYWYRGRRYCRACTKTNRDNRRAKAKLK